MNIKKVLSFKVVAGVLFGLSVSAIGLLGMVSYQYNKHSNDTSFWVKHSYVVIAHIDEVSSLYKDIQLESIAFFNSETPDLIPLYTNSKKILWEKISNIRSLTSENQDQQRRIDSLEFLVNGLISSADSVFSIGKMGNYSDTFLQNRVRSNTIFRNRIRKMIQDMKNEENYLLAIREEANKESIAAFNSTFYQLLGGICILLVTTFFFVRNNFNKRIRSEQELKNANELFYKLFHESPIGMVMSHSANEMIIDCNRAYSELINNSREEIIGKTPIMLKTVDSEDHYNKIISDARKNGKVEAIEVQLKPNGKDPIWTSISIQSISIQNRQCLLFAILDMTVHKKAEEEIKKVLAVEIELNKMKYNFVTMASHEFRTPLSTILSSTFLLENHPFGENREVVVKHLGRIRSSVGNLTFLLDEFLSLTKIEEGKVEPKLESLNVKQYLDCFLPNFRNLTKTGQKIIYDHSGDFYFYTDPVLLGNILNNLVSNAIKYSPENSIIHILSDIDGQFRLTVKDAGIGIPLEDQKHLFGRFYRASNAGTAQGTGLGLHIMKQYIDMLKGTVKINSDLNKGTEFIITLGDLSQVYG